MQALAPSWTPPGGVLGGILRGAESRVAQALPGRAALERAARETRTPPPFASSLRRSTVAVIAEVKRRSPSKGAIRPELDAAAQAAAYVAGGAAAISVLTEPDHFGGSLQDLSGVVGRVPVPALRKDFLIHPVQLLEARAAGASAVLLIARALAPAAFGEMCDAARSTGLEILAEVRDEWELERALSANVEVIGVNNRNLETLEIDDATAEALIPAIPADRIAVWESGVRTVDDVLRAASAGADAVLVGSSVSAAGDPASAVAALAGVSVDPGRGGRGGRRG